MLRRDRLFSFLIAVMWVAAPAGIVSAEAADFYRGKQVTVVVGFTPGGTYDLAMLDVASNDASGGRAEAARRRGRALFRSHNVKQPSRQQISFPRRIRARVLKLCPPR
jgi:hypothetical protein